MDPFETVAYLARSRNRLAVLETLRESACDRRTVQERVDASKVTVNRILNDFEDREWVVRERGEYRATPRGDLVARQFGDLVGTLALADELGDLVEELPVSEFDFPLSQLGDAEVVVPTTESPSGPTERGAAFLATADRIRVLASAVASTTVRASAEHAASGGDLEVVLSAPVLDVVRERPDLRAAHLDIVEAGGTIRCYEDDLPFTLVLVDDFVVVGLVGEGGGQAFLVSENSLVRDWAEAYYERHREAATPLAAPAFAPVDGRD